MWEAVEILMISVELLMWYLQATCQRILRREFSHDFFLSVTNANRLDSRFLCKALEEFDVPADHEHSRMKLKCDFLALTYLLKNLCDSRGRLPKEQRLLAHPAFLLVLIIVHTIR